MIKKFLLCLTVAVLLLSAGANTEANAQAVFRNNIFQRNASVDGNYLESIAPGMYNVSGDAAVVNPDSPSFNNYFTPSGTAINAGNASYLPAGYVPRTINGTMRLGSGGGIDAGAYQTNPAVLVKATELSAGALFCNNLIYRNNANFNGYIGADNSAAAGFELTAGPYERYNLDSGNLTGVLESDAMYSSTGAISPDNYFYPGNAAVGGSRDCYFSVIDTGSATDIDIAGRQHGCYNHAYGAYTPKSSPAAVSPVIDMLLLTPSHIGLESGDKATLAVSINPVNPVVWSPNININDINSVNPTISSGAGNITYTVTTSDSNYCVISHNVHVTNLKLLMRNNIFSHNHATYSGYEEVIVGTSSVSRTRFNLAKTNATNAFVLADEKITPDNYFTVKTAGPAFGKGDASFYHTDRYPLRSIDSTPRPWCGIVDIGAYQISKSGTAAHPNLVRYPETGIICYADTVLFAFDVENKPSWRLLYRDSTLPGAAPWNNPWVGIPGTNNFLAAPVFRSGYYRTGPQGYCDDMGAYSDSVLVTVRKAPTYISGDSIICFGGSYLSGDGTVYTSDAVVKDTVYENGCVAFYRDLNLEFLTKAPDTLFIFDTICSGQIYSDNGFTVGSAGVSFLTVQNAYGCDSTLKLDLTVLEPRSVPRNEYLCYGDTLCYTYASSGETKKYWQNTVIRDTFKFAQSGCDSIHLTINLIVHPKVDTLKLTGDICYGEIYNSNGFYRNTTGVYYRTVINANNCDSIIMLTLTVSPDPALQVVDTSVCYGGSYTYKGITYTSNTVIRDTFKSVYGCDSVYKTINFKVRPFVDTLRFIDSICYGYSYTINGFNASAAGLYYLPATDNNGCPYTKELNLSIKAAADTMKFSDTLCYGERYSANGFDAASSGKYYRVLQLAAANGCDSVVMLTLFVYPQVPVNNLGNKLLCNGAGFDFNGTMLYASGEYFDTLPSVLTGCDSVIRVSITASKSDTARIEAARCYGTAYNDYGFNIACNVAGTDTFYRPNPVAGSCGDVLKLVLTVYPEPVLNKIFDTACLNDSYTKYGFNFTAKNSGISTRIIKNERGCDSTLELNLTVKQPAFHDRGLQNICSGSSSYYDFNGEHIYENGIYYDTFYGGAYNGCDSIEKVTVRNVLGDTMTVIENICYGTTYGDFGFSEDSNGVYQYYVECSPTDSGLVMLFLNLFPPVDTGRVYDTVCYGETYTGHGFNESAGGIYRHIIPNINGCDSTVELHLYVFPDVPVTDIAPPVLCVGDSFLFYDRYISGSGVYTHVIESSETGCDSVVRMSITATAADTIPVVASICYGSTYKGNNFNVAGNFTGTRNFYNFEDLGADCMTVIKLTLTVYPEIPETPVFASVCSGGKYNFFGSVLAASGVYYHSLLSANGCDSTIKLTLTVNPLAEDVVYDSICFGDKYTGYGLNDSTSVYREMLYGCAAGGDSVLVKLHLTAVRIDTTVLQIVLHEGDTFDFFGEKLDTFALRHHTLAGTHGCDSVIRLELNWAPPLAIEMDMGSEFICYGDTFDFRSLKLTASGIYRDTSFLGERDSIFIMELEVGQAPLTYTYHDTICYGDVYSANGFNASNGIVADSSGVYEYSVKGADNCDSIVYRLNLYRFAPADTLRIDAVLCYQETYDANGFYTNTAGIYTRIEQNSHGCDSVILLNLKIKPRPVPTNLGTVVLCYGSFYVMGTDTLREMGVETYTLTDSEGCDSLVRISIVTMESDTVEFTQTICYGTVLTDYDFNADSTGTYEKMFSCPDGGDSVLVIAHVKVLPFVDTGKITDTVYVGELYSNSSFVLQLAVEGTFYFHRTIDNPNGCDSIIELRLTAIERPPVIPGDTVYTCASGKVYGLSAGELPVRIYYSFTGTPLSYVISSSTLDADGGASYSLCDVMVGSQLSLFGESREGYMIDEFYDRIPVSDTLRGINFHYNRIPSVGYNLANGTVYVRDTATEGILINYLVNGSEGWTVSMADGSYFVPFADNSSLEVHPTVLQPYNVSPRAYAADRIASDTSGWNFYYDFFSVDTSELFSACGVLQGLDSAEARNRVVQYTVSGAVGYAVTNRDGAYCIENLLAGSELYVVAPSVAGYKVEPVSQTLLVASDTSLVPFVYSRSSGSDKDSVRLCGTVYGLPYKAGIQVFYSVNMSSYNVVQTDIDGNYCISALKGDYIHIIPSSQTDYSVFPQEYAFNADFNADGLNNILYDFTYTHIPDGSVTVSGEVFKDAAAYGNAPLHYTIDGVPGIVFTNPYGWFYMYGIAPGSDIVLTPDRNNGYSVTPGFHTVVDIARDTVLEPTVYMRESSCGAYYAVRGALYGLPVALQENRAAHYDLNGVAGSPAVLSDISGHYAVDSLCSGTVIKIYAPFVEGYTASPAFHEINIAADYNGANFVYKKEPYIEPAACASGKVYGLSASELPVRIYYSVTGTPLSYVMSSSALDADGGASWSLCDIPVGSRLSLFGESRNGYIIREFYDRISVTEDMQGLNFHYDSIPSEGYHIAGGTVYVRDAATEGILVNYLIDNSEGWAVSMADGSYFVPFADSSSLKVFPTVLHPYDVSPAGGYNSDFVTNNISGWDFHYNFFSDTSSLLRTCGVLEGLDSNLLGNQVVRYTVGGAIGYAVSDRDGVYCINNLLLGSELYVVAPSVAGYKVEPVSQTLEVNASAVLVPFVYSRLSADGGKDTATVCGNVSGLLNNGGVEVYYSVNLSDYRTVITDADGNYCISVLQGDYVHIIPSSQAGYSVAPQYYSLNSDNLDGSGYDFVYSGVAAGSLSISGEVFKDAVAYPYAPLHYTIDGAESAGGVVFSDASGMFNLYGIAAGSDVTVVPDILNGYSVNPALQTVLNIVRDTILYPTVYLPDYSCRERYAVKGALYGLPAELQENRAAMYNLDGVPSGVPALSSAAGTYIIDKICKGTQVKVYAPFVEGYTAYPAFYDIDLEADYHGANFVYSKNPYKEPRTCVSGKIYGLSASDLPVRIYYSTSGTPLTYTISSSVLDADGGAVWSLCGVLVGAQFSAFAEARRGYMVHEFYDRLLVTDSMHGLNFHYDSIPSNYSLATGTVYVDDTVAEGILIHYSIDNSEGWTVSMPGGDYFIAVPDSTSLVINPTIIQGYYVKPNAYVRNRIVTDVSGLDFRYTRYSDSTILYSMCGSLTGLTETERNRRVVFYTVDEVLGYTVTNRDGKYCIGNLPLGAVVVVTAPSIVGYIVNPLSQTVVIAPSNELVPFVYTKGSGDAVTVCGNVSGLPDNGGIEVLYSVNASWYRVVTTDSAGNYCITVLSGDYLRIVPNAILGYNASPQIYMFNADSGSSNTSYDFVYSVVAGTGLLTVSGVVMRDEERYAGAPLHYRVSADSSIYEGVVYVNASGEFYLQGLDTGCNVLIVPDYLRNYEVTPDSHLVFNLQHDTVLDTTYYRHKPCDESYFVRGALFGLPLNLQVNRAVEYFIDSVPSGNPGLTDAFGVYTIDYVCSGKQIIVHAPVVSGYNAYPPYYNINVPGDYYGANFVYVKVSDPDEPDSVYITSLTINGDSVAVSDTIRYIVPCGSNLTWLDVVFTVSDNDSCAGVNATGKVFEYRYTVDLSDKAVYRIDTVTLFSTVPVTIAAGGLMHTYYIIIEKRFEFYDIVSEFFDNAFVVNNNPINNGGYRFVWYQWYRDEVPVGNDQDYSVGVSALLSYNPNSLYRVEMLTENGTPLRTCADKSGVTVVYSLYPNPAPSRSKVHFNNTAMLSDYTSAVLYSANGAVVWQGLPSAIAAGGLNAPSSSGAYVLVLSNGRGGSVKYKLIVK